MRILTGLKAETSNKEICAKDIVFTIISAANRKMQKARYRKGGASGSDEGKEASVDIHESDKQVRDSIHLGRCIYL